VTGELGSRARKPSSRPFSAVLDLLGVAAEDAVYVADNPVKDFLGANRIGMGTIRIRHSQGLYAGLEPSSPRYAPDAEVTTFEDLEALVTSWRETSPAVPVWRA
jgi:putative hydrolase of the HAD superfamily